MDVKQAIATAKNYVRNVYDSEQISDLGLEEVVYDDARANWFITLAFSRPWDKPQSRVPKMLDALVAYDLVMGHPLQRSYKVVTVSRDGAVIEMKNRPLMDIGE